MRCRAAGEPDTPSAPADADAEADVPGLPSKARAESAVPSTPLLLLRLTWPRPQRRARLADSTDPISTFLTRRFGLAGGLAWLGLLTVGVVSEQVKTRREVAREESGTQAVSAVEVVTASGLRYVDLVRGGGETAPQRGYLLAADVRVTLDDADGAVLFDTAATQRPLAFFFGCGDGRSVRRMPPRP